jgi:hypothetical protein
VGWFGIDFPTADITTSGSACGVIYACSPLWQAGANGPVEGPRRDIDFYAGMARHLS